MKKLALALAFTIILSGCASIPFSNRESQNEQQLPTQADITAAENAETVDLEDATFQLVDPVEETGQPDTEPAPLEFDFSDEGVATDLETEPEELPLEGNNELEAGTNIPLTGGVEPVPQEPISEPEPQEEVEATPEPEPAPVVTSFESDEALPTTSDASSMVVVPIIVLVGVLVCIHSVLRRKIP